MHKNQLKRFFFNYILFIVLSYYSEFINPLSNVVFAEWTSNTFYHLFLSQRELLGLSSIIEH